MGNPWEVAFVIGWMALWVLFPVGIFLSISKIDQNTDQLERTAMRRHLITRQTAREVPKVGFHLPHFANPFRHVLRH